MKKYGFLLMSVLMAAVPAVTLAFNQGDLTRLLGGDNNMQNADLSGIGVGELTRKDLKSVDFTGADFRNCRLWGYQFDGYARTVDTHVRRLRQKLGQYSDWVETVRGVGYRFRE